MQVLFAIMVQIKQKRGIGVESPSPKSFSGGVGLFHKRNLTLNEPMNSVMMIVVTIPNWSLL